MAGSVTRNVQRGTILLEELILVVVITFVTVKLIKRRVDLYSRSKGYMESEADSAQDKVKERELEEERKDSETTIQAFDKGVIESTSLDDEDSCVDRLLKKIVEFNLGFHPLMMAFPLSFVTGRSDAAAIVLFIFALLTCFLFNTFKVHRACVDHFMPRWVFENASNAFCIAMCAQIMVSDPINMPYLLQQH